MNTPARYFMIRKASGFCPPHINPELEIVWVRRGMLTITYDATELQLRQGEMTAVFPYHLHSFLPADDTDAVVLMFSPIIYENFAENVEKGVFNIRKLVLLEEQYVQKLLEENSDLQTPTQAKCLFYVCTDILSKGNPAKNTYGKGDLAPDVLKFIFDHMEEDFDIACMARHLGWDPRKLSTVFRDTYGIKLTDLIGNVRTERAITLLESSNLSISQIAITCGFGSLRNFNRVFQNRISCTPSEYRSQRKK